MVDRRSLRRIRSATVVVIVVVIVLVVCVVRVVVHGVGGRAAVQATAAWPVVAGRRRIVSSGGGGGPRAVGSPCGSKNEGKNQRGEKTAAKGVVECAANGRGAFGAGSDLSDVDGVRRVLYYIGDDDDD